MTSTLQTGLWLFFTIRKKKPCIFERVAAIPLNLAYWAAKNPCVACDVASNQPREPCQVLQEQTGMSSQQPTSIPQHPWDALHVIGPLQWSLQKKQSLKQSLSNIWELVGPAAENSATYLSNLKLRNVHTKPASPKGRLLFS